MRKLDKRLDSQIKTMIVLREKLINETYGMQAPLLHTSSNTPDMWPVKGTISSTYGFRSSPGGIGSTYHEGIDIAVDYGSPIEATASGVVTQAGWVGGYGNLVEIKHDGGLVTRYGHPGVRGTAGGTGHRHRPGRQHRKQHRSPLPL